MQNFKVIQHESVADVSNHSSQNQIVDKFHYFSDFQSHENDFPHHSKETLFNKKYSISSTINSDPCFDGDLKQTGEFNMLRQAQETDCAENGAQ